MRLKVTPECARSVIYLSPTGRITVVSVNGAYYEWIIIVPGFTIGLAVGGMTVWQTYLIATAQTTIEYYGNSVEKTIAKRRGDVFFNEYDLGTSRNFKIFFNISGRRKWPSIFWPVPVPPMGSSFYLCSLRSVTSSC
ncbi:hypothetical protein BC832DRAFT_284510 [Gaertneriomyces semiglobifer]|nr:hypothetical protein BC832DRAFT_284510 [Gaertneriomyces semiglobifer]